MLDEFKNAFQRYNNGHVQLIIINVVVFLVMALVYVVTKASGVPEIFDVMHREIAIPALFSTWLTRPWTIITYAFAHDLSGIFHILFNMMAFYWFAKLFIEYLGNDKLIALYFLGALAGGVAFLIVFNTIPYYSAYSGAVAMVGASAAVYAVIVGAATLLPEYTFFLMFLGPIKIKYIALGFIVISFLGSVGENAGGNVAHLGGALMGFVYVKQLQAGNNWGGWITAIIGFVSNIFKPRAKVKVTYRKTEPKKAAGSGKPFSKATEAEINAILDKISDGGYESLTKDEKDKLFNASNKN